MRLSAVRGTAALSLSVFLVACGGDASTNNPAAGAAAASTAAVSGSGSSAGNAPLPDCHSNGCTQPQVIDGLAEAYRADALRAAAVSAAPAAAPPTQ